MVYCCRVSSILKPLYVIAVPSLGGDGEDREQQATSGATMTLTWMASSLNAVLFIAQIFGKGFHDEICLCVGLFNESRPQIASFSKLLPPPCTVLHTPF